MTVSRGSLQFKEIICNRDGAVYGECECRNRAKCRHRSMTSASSERWQAVILTSTISSRIHQRQVPDTCEQHEAQGGARGVEIAEGCLRDLEMTAQDRLSSAIVPSHASRTLKDPAWSFKPALPTVAY